MTAQAIEQVTALEREQRALCDAAVAEGKQKILMAQRAGARALEDNRQISEAEVRKMLQQAEAEAAAEAKKAYAEAEKRCEEIKREACSRLESAAAHIAEKVVGN